MNLTISPACWVSSPKIKQKLAPTYLPTSYDPRSLIACAVSFLRSVHAAHMLFGFLPLFRRIFVSSRIPAEYWDFSRVTSTLLPSFILTPGIWVSFVSFPSDNFSTWVFAGGGLLTFILGWSLLIPLSGVGVWGYIFRSLSFFLWILWGLVGTLEFLYLWHAFILAMAWVFKMAVLPCSVGLPAPSHLRSVALAQ